MNLNEKLTALIVKLNKLTLQGKLTWKIKEPPRLMIQGTDSHIPFYVVTEYQGQSFALYQCRSLEQEQPSYQSSLLSLPAFARPPLTNYWDERVILALIDKQGRVLWEEESQQSALSDLLETVRRKVSNIDNVIDALLSDDEENIAALHH